MTTTLDRTSGVDSAVALSLRGVSRTFGSTVAVAPLTLTLHAGTVCTVSGPNGSGKTTLLRLAAGLLAPSAGERHCRGRSLYLAGGGGVRAQQAPRDAVAFVLAVCRSGVEVDEVLDRCQLTGMSDVPAGRLSTGQRARVTLAVALAARPALVCLDEPTSSLDADGVAVATSVLAALRDAGCAVLVASHDPTLTAGAADAHISLYAGQLRRCRP